MALAAGSTVGPYEIVAPLGEGGMGKVYRARDTQLGRDVAIKALPDSLADDPERVARFQREAQVLASLHHPNIAGIYGLERAGTARYLVLELVEGVTLADHLAQTAGGMPVGEAIPIAREIIDALEAAHEKGIVHRDLKPANIMLGADGHAKVLDFGLARVVEPDPAGIPTNSPTLTFAATQAGLILGTAAYMSPEQAKGRVADKRSDVWAFGCVFYEMLTGSRLFDGEDVSETLAAVLRAEPDWTALPAGVPHGIQTLLRRCLDRDRKTRVPDMAVVRYLLQDAMTPAAPPVAAPTSAQRAGYAWSLWLSVAFAGGVVATVVGAWVAGAWPPETRSSPVPMRFGINPPAGERLAPTIANRQLAISPDGRYLVYVSGTNSGGGQLMLRPIGRLEATPIAGGAGARGPFFSPDGKWIGYFTTTELRKIPTAGGASSLICPIDSSPRGATWAPDDTIVFATVLPNTGLLSVPAAGGSPKTLTTPAHGQGEGDHVFPSVLPDGRAVLFTIVPSSFQLSGAQIAVFELSTGTKTVLASGGTSPEYVEPGYLAYAAGTTLRAVRFDRDRRRILGDPVQVVDDIAVSRASGTAQYTLSRSGVLVYVPAAFGGMRGAEGPRTIVWVSRQGREEPIKEVPPRSYFNMRLSPDGTRLALDIRDQDNDVWVWDLLRSVLTRLTVDPAPDLFPIWTRDSRRIVFSSARNGAMNLYWQPADGTGTVERLTESTDAQYANSFSVDNSSVLINEINKGQNPNIVALRLDGKRQTVPLLESPAVERVADISPDGRFVAYESDESSRSEIYVRPFPNVDAGKWQISTAGGTKPAWSPTGRELFYIDATSKLTAVPVQVSSTFQAGNPTALFEARNTSSLISARFYDVARDGQRFVMIKELPPPPAETPVPTSPTFIVTLNWAEELRVRTAK